jgi:hypothetical protein
MWRCAFIISLFEVAHRFLASLDPPCSLKAVLSYPEDGSIADMLCLTFVDTVASSTAPLHEEDMIPGGADVDVTDVNKHQ